MFHFCFPKGVDVDVRNLKGQTPLMFALAFQTAKLLLDHGADPNATGVERQGYRRGHHFPGRGPLHIASNRRNPGVVKALLEHPLTKIDLMDQAGSTPLMDASRVGCAEIVKMIMGQGPDLYLGNRQGQLSLHWAGNASVVDALLEGLSDEGKDS